VRTVRQIIYIDEKICDSCGKCIRSCIEGALRITDARLRLVAEKFCDGCGACVGTCPTGALKIEEREADEWQELVYVRC
jgi:Na+-translocating ferredoxin:NAD+ oxidoreductase RNF subunit RnfB